MRSTRARGFRAAARSTLVASGLLLAMAGAAAPAGAFDAVPAPNAPDASHASTSGSVCDALQVITLLLVGYTAPTVHGDAAACGVGTVVLPTASDAMIDGPAPSCDVLEAGRSLAQAILAVTGIPAPDDSAVADAAGCPAAGTPPPAPQAAPSAPAADGTADADAGVDGALSPLDLSTSFELAAPSAPTASSSEAAPSGGGTTATGATATLDQTAQASSTRPVAPSSVAETLLALIGLGATAALAVRAIRRGQSITAREARP